MNLQVSDRFQDIFVGDGEMANLMRNHDWENSSVGSPSSWPDALKVAIRLLLTSKFQMWLGWGPDIAFFYNDAYRPTLGAKHPNALAVPTKVLWSEIWSDIEGRLETVYKHGQSTWDKDLPLLLERNGYTEESYHTFSYSPLIGDSGIVEGVFCAVTEETERVVSERRMSTMRALASGLAAADTKDEVLQASFTALGGNLHDLPFSALYLFDKDGNATRQWLCGEHNDPTFLPAEIVLGTGLWYIEDVWTKQIVELIDLPAISDASSEPWHKAPLQAAVLPLIGQGNEVPKGILISGLNPYQPAGDDYLDFLKLIAGQITSRLASAEAFETERRRAAALAEAAAMREQAATALEQVNRQLSSEIKLRTAERDRMRVLFQQAPSFMCILSGPDHVFELVNDAYLKLVGNRHLVGLSVRDALPDLAGQGFFELLDKVYQSGEPYIGNYLPVTLQHNNDCIPDKRFINLIYQPILDVDGLVTGIFVDGFDVTDQKRAESELQSLNQTLEERVEQRTRELSTALLDLEKETVDRENAQNALRQAQKMEALGNLTGGVAHDFNNLLQVVSGNLQLLSKSIHGNIQAEQRLENALAGVERGSKLASQLLAFGRRQPLEPKVINVRKLVQNMDDMLRRALGEEIELETIVSGGLWNTMIDPSQLENAILNLAINARDAMGGRGHLTIETANSYLDDDYAREHEDVRPGQYVLVAVTDTGSGIPLDIIEQIVEPFFSTKTDGRGTGLGLSMVYGFLKQSGGHLKIYSEVGHGTTMKLYLPRTTQMEDTLTDASGLPAVGGTETVLVVEDDDGVRETSVALLSDLGYRVLKANDAQSAFAIVNSGVEIDLLFTDVVMPGPMRSTELAKKAKTLFPAMAVLYTSGYTENSIMHGGRLEAGVELLSKPYTREALARKVRHVLSNTKQQQIALQREENQKKVQGENQNFIAKELTRVLVVEDEPLILMSTVDMVEELGYIVIEAESAESAISILEADKVDVLLTDVGLPGMSGIELAQKVNEKWPDVRIIFASGNSNAKATSGLADAFQVSKPFMMEQLRVVLEESTTLKSL